MIRRLPTSLTTILATLLACAWGSCNPPERGQELALRWIDEEPDSALDPLALLRRDTVIEWPLETPADLAEWLRVGDRERLSFEGGIATFSSTLPHVRIGRRVDLDAAAIDAIEIEAPYDALEGPILRWAGPGQKLAKERSAEPRPAHFAGDQGRVFSFRLRGHPGWSGRVTRLQLRFRNPRRRPPRLYRIRAVRETADAPRLAAAAARSWKATLDSETRNVLLALPGLPLDRQLTVPASGELRLSYGVEPTQPTHTTLRVTASEADRESKLLFETVALSGNGGAAGWHEARIDLASVNKPRTSTL